MSDPEYWRVYSDVAGIDAAIAMRTTEPVAVTALIVWDVPAVGVLTVNPAELSVPPSIGSLIVRVMVLPYLVTESIVGALGSPLESI